MNTLPCDSNQKHLNNKGFSLVELIIVIAIMAVLVATLAPQYTKYVERARVQTDLTALSELKQAIVLACIDPINTSFPAVVTVNGSTGVISYPDGYTTAQNGIRDDIEVVIGSPLPLKSATARGKTYTITISDANGDGVWDFIQNWNADGTT